MSMYACILLSNDFDMYQKQHQPFKFQVHHLRKCQSHTSYSRIKDRKPKTNKNTLPTHPSLCPLPPQKPKMHSPARLHTERC